MARKKQPAPVPLMPTRPTVDKAYLDRMYDSMQLQAVHPMAVIAIRDAIYRLVIDLGHPAEAKEWADVARM
jgi:hypothetical protein